MSLLFCYFMTYWTVHRRYSTTITHSSCCCTEIERGRAEQLKLSSDLRSVMSGRQHAGSHPRLQLATLTLQGRGDASGRMNSIWFWEHLITGTIQLIMTCSISPPLHHVFFCYRFDKWQSFTELHCCISGVRVWADGLDGWGLINTGISLDLRRVSYVHPCQIINALPE